MKCDLAKDKLMDYLYDEVSGAERAEIETHLANCSACASELAQLRQTARVLRAWPDEAPNLNLRFVQEKIRVLDSLKTKLAHGWRGRKLMAGFAAGLALALIILSLLNFEASYSEGTLQVKLSPFSSPQKETPPEPGALPVTQEEFQAWKQTSYELMQQMIQTAAARQRYEQNLVLSELARDLDLRRRQDLQRVGKGLEALQLVNDNQFRRTNEVLQQLLYVAQYQNSDSNYIENK
jgi:hypothetical protein